MSADLTTTPVELPHRGRYRLVPSRSAARFTVGELFGLIRVHGTFSIQDGEVAIDDERAVVTAHLDAASVCTGNKRRDKDLRSARFLDVARFPQLTFEGSLRTGEPAVTGRLTAHGLMATCALHIREIHHHDDRIEVVATTRVDRYAHWITAGRGLIARHVDVEISATLLPNP